MIFYPDLKYPYLGLQTALATIDISNCGLGSASVAARLAEVVANGVSAGTLDIGGSNSSPNPAGVTSLLALEDDSWTLTYSTVIMENTGSFYAITANGDATIRSSATDLSGQTAKYIVVMDSAGKYAFAYGHAADSAEALGGELLTAINARSEPYTPDTFTVNANGYDIDAWVDNDTLSLAYSNNCGFLTGYLYKIVTTVAFSAGTDLSLWTTNSANSLELLLANPLSGTQSHYFTRLSTASVGIGLRGAGNISFSLVWSAKQVTALGTDALQLRNQLAESGSSRNWTSIESGFDPNTISKIEVFLG